MAILGEDLDRAAPTEFATFKKLRGDAGRPAGGRRVRGAHARPLGRPGARGGAQRQLLPAGHARRAISRRARSASAPRRDDGRLMFAIESWARGGDRLSNLLYDRLRMSKEIQFHMWTSFLERVVKLSGGSARRRPADPHPPRRRASDRSRCDAPLAARAARQGAQLRPRRSRPRSRARVAGKSTTTASRCRPSARPARARRQLGAGQAADARLRVRRPEDRARRVRPRLARSRAATCCSRRASGAAALSLRRAGGRAGRREPRAATGRPVRIWGWSYRTLQGHLEMGQMDYEVWKWLDDGERRVPHPRGLPPARASRIRSSGWASGSSAAASRCGSRGGPASAWPACWPAGRSTASAK